MPCWRAPVEATQPGPGSLTDQESAHEHLRRVAALVRARLDEAEDVSKIMQQACDLYRVQRFTIDGLPEREMPLVKENKCARCSAGA